MNAMNLQPNVVPGSGAPGVTSAAMSPTHLFYWSVRRELWENRSLYIAPLAVAAVYLFGFLIGTIRLPQKMRALSTMDQAHQRSAVGLPYDFAAGLLMATTLIVAVFYCLDALYGERRDRSILFWKSLPVSDLITVLSKAFIPIVLLQLVAFVVTVALQLIMLLFSSVVLLGNGSSIAMLWTQLSLFQRSVMLFFHLVALHGLWYAPIYCWLLLVSGWARRAAFLWAVLPVIAIGVVEKVAFNTTHFGSFLGYRLIGGTDADAMPALSGLPLDPMTRMVVGRYLTSPGLWIGLLFAAVFLAAAVRLRRYREPI